MNLAEMTPREIDTELARLHGAKRQAETRAASALETLHSVTGQRERREYFGRKVRMVWPVSDEDTVTLARTAAERGESAPLMYSGRPVAEFVRKYDEAVSAGVELAAEIAILSDEYTRRPWPRFFIVQNNGGHIHSSMNCQTCNKNGSWTDFGWLPELSGLTEEDAVKAHGPLLCTVCYPSAPLDWTKGKDKPARCDGAAVAGTVRYVGINPYAKCSECHERQRMNANGTLRAHKPKA